MASPWLMFLHQLAVTLRTPIDEIKATHDSEQLSTWLAFFELQPQGEQRADLRMGILAAALVNMWSREGSTPRRPLDFMPYVHEYEPEPKDVPARVHEAMARLTAHFNRRNPT